MVSFPNPLFLCSFSLRIKSSELDEDEGFGDWSQKIEQRQQTWGNEGTAEGSEPSQSESPEEKQAEDRQVWTRPGRALALSEPSLGLDNSFLSALPQKAPKMVRGCEAGREVGKKGDRWQGGQ